MASAPQFDCLVVDEGQDFEPEWSDIVQMFLSDDASQLWLEDPLQNLRSTNSIVLPGFVTYAETSNFRTPTRIAEFIKPVLEVEFKQRNCLPGLGVGLYEYEAQSELAPLLATRVKELEKVGFELEDIAIVSCRGMATTALANIQYIGKHQLRKFTGKYNHENEQIYTNGRLSFDTIYRFKGQQAATVILVDLDGSLTVNDRNRQVLYCAMTRGPRFGWNWLWRGPVPGATSSQSNLEEIAA